MSLEKSRPPLSPTHRPLLLISAVSGLLLTIVSCTATARSGPNSRSQPGAEQTKQAEQTENNDATGNPTSDVASDAERDPTLEPTYDTTDTTDPAPAAGTRVASRASSPESRSTDAVDSPPSATAPTAAKQDGPTVAAASGTTDADVDENFEEYAADFGLDIPDEVDEPSKLQPVTSDVLGAVFLLMSDDDGSKPAELSRAQAEEWVATANKIFKPAKLNLRVELMERVANTTLNGFGMGEDKAIRREAKRLANQYVGKVVVIVRHGKGKKPVGKGFSGLRSNYIVMPGYQGAHNCGKAQPDLFSHEVGHYLGLQHTFRGEPVESMREATRKLQAEGGKPAAFDGDGLADTAPDPAIRPTHCESPKELRIGGQVFNPPSNNVMSYYDARDRISESQAEIARWVIQQRRKFAMKMPVHTSIRNPIEAEKLVVKKKRCKESNVVTEMSGRRKEDRWGGDKQLVCAGKGAEVTVELPVPAAGRYRLVAFITRGPSFGAIEFRLNGKRIGSTIDARAPITNPSGAVRLGSYQLRKGKHTLNIRGVDAKGARIGLDAFRLVPLDGKKKGGKKRR